MLRDTLTILVLITALLLNPLHSPNHVLTNQVISEVFEKNTSGFKLVVFYYGWLNTSNILDYNIDILVVDGSYRIFPNGPDHQIIKEAMRKGIEVYAYLHDDSDNPIGLGSYYNKVVSGEINYSAFVKNIEEWITKYKGLVTGIFLDECDPGYFGTTDPNNEYLKLFNKALKNITRYAHSIGLKVFINGVRAYAYLGDYYLWEDFVAIYSNNTYTIDKNFYTIDNSTLKNPYIWVNGLTKYYFLKQNKTLNKTIALSYADASHIHNAVYAYYMARILGLKGWSFSPIDVYSWGEAIYPLNVYETGPPITEPVIDRSKNASYRVFILGNISVYQKDEIIIKPKTEPSLKPLLDGQADQTYVFMNASLDKTGFFKKIGYIATFPNELYLYINYTTQQLTTTPTTRILIDIDGNTSTGYYLHNLGADIMIDIEKNTSIIYNYSGNTWVYYKVVPSITKVYENQVIIELGIKIEFTINKTKFITIISINGTEVAYSKPITIDRVVPTYPSIYDPINRYHINQPIISRIDIKNKYTYLEVHAPANSIEKYIFYLPYKDIGAVYKNETLLKEISSSENINDGYMVEKRGNIVILTIYLHHVKEDIMLKIYPAIKTPNVLKLVFNEIVFIILILIIIIILLYLLFKRTGFSLN